jgi:transposase
LQALFDEAEITSDPESEPEIEDDEGAPSPSKKKRKKKRAAIPAHLPRQIIEHDLSAEEKSCAADGSALRNMGYDVKLELHYTPAKFSVLEHRFPKYSCDQCKGAPVRKAPLPILIPQSYASAHLLAQIAVAKFCDHLPLYRQEQIYGRTGVHLTRQVMADWMIKLGNGLNPLIGIIHERILDGPIVNADETPVRVLTKEGVRTSHQAYMWQLSSWSSRPLVFFEFDMTRKKEVAQKLLGTYEGYVQIDGYSGYDTLFSESTARIRVGCMAHVLRKFKDILASTKKELRSAHPAIKIVKMVKKLYEIEEVCRALGHEERLASRIEHEADQRFSELITSVADELQSTAKGSPYYTALHYAHNELPHIRHYLEHGAIEIDNNRAENTIRPFALGRRNWLFMCNETGAQASANIYSLLQTAKANSLEPTEYLTRVIDRLPYCSTVEDLEELLPS